MSVHKLDQSEGRETVSAYGNYMLNRQQVTKQGKGPTDPLLVICGRVSQPYTATSEPVSTFIIF